MPLPLQTPRLTLRSPRVEDAETLLAVFGDPEVMRYVGDGRTRNQEVLRFAAEEVGLRRLISVIPTTWPL